MVNPFAITRRLLAVVFLTTSTIIWQPALAKALPPDVQAAYRTYEAALETGDQIAISDAAYDAWMEAEDHLGDHRTTGDLAQNYAMIGYTPTIKLSNRINKAFDRSIELARFYEDEAADIEVQRRLMKIDSLLNRPKSVPDGLAGFTATVKGEEDMEVLERRLVEAGLTRSTYAGELLGMRSKYHWVKGEWAKAVSYADKAISALDGATIRVPSIQPISVRFFKARALTQLQRPIEALLTYQEIVDVSREADILEATDDSVYSEMFRLQGLMILSGGLQAAIDAGYKPITSEDYPKIEERPIISSPPQTPSNARRSGWVTVKMDVDPNGSPFNIQLVDSSERTFIRNALRSVETWKYRPAADGTARKDVEMTIRFVVLDRFGNPLAPKKPRPLK